LGFGSIGTESTHTRLFLAISRIIIQILIELKAQALRLVPFALAILI
jgi:hypothetical protein